MATSTARTLLTLAASALLLATAACSFSFGSSSSHAVSKRDVESQISSTLTDANGNKPTSVSCPKDLDAKVGAQLNCTAQGKDHSSTVNVTVTGVNGSDVKFDIVPMFDKDKVIQQISTKLTDPAGNKPDSVTCPGDLLGKVGAQLNCDMKVKGTPWGVTVTVTRVAGTDVFFDMAETLDRNQVAKTLTDTYTEQQGHKPDSVTCPNNLDGTMGATMRCQLTDGGKNYGVTVRFTGIDDSGTVNLHFDIDDQPS
jgi:hypothetical protein